MNTPEQKQQQLSISDHQARLSADLKLLEERKLTIDDDIKVIKAMLKAYEKHSPKQDANNSNATTQTQGGK